MHSTNQPLVHKKFVDSEMNTAVDTQRATRILSHTAKPFGKGAHGADHDSSTRERHLTKPHDQKKRAAAQSIHQSPSTPGEHKTKSTSRRPRLIDALASQRSTSPEESLAVGNVDSSATAGSEILSLPPKTTPGQDWRSNATDRRGGASTSRKVKLTYSQSRSTLSGSREMDEPGSIESPDEDDTTFTQMLSNPARDTDMDKNVTNDSNSQPAIKSVHELRRSGANNRFADEMDDLLTRIGTPGAGPLSIRRNALCELAQSLPRVSFAEQFRDHASRDKVAREIGREDDLVSGFALAAVIVIFLNSGPAPHLVRQLSQEGLGRHLGRLLRVSEEIDSVATRKAMNLPRTTKALLHSVKSILMRMPIWHGMQPIRISPRTLGLQVLKTVARCANKQLLEQVVVDLGEDFVVVAADCAEAGATPDTVDYTLTVLGLEVLSSAGVATTDLDSQGPSRRQLPASIAKFLRNSMQRWPSERGELEAIILKLSIDTTNTKWGAAAFDDAKLLSLLGDCVAEGYKRIRNAVGSGSLESDLYDELILLLGVMINIVEHNQPARTTLGDEPLDGLVALWRGNSQTVSEVRGQRDAFPTQTSNMSSCTGLLTYTVRMLSKADSVDKSKVNVALGYLAVLLGYLCLTERGRDRIKSRFSNGEGIRSLIGSIQDFTAMYKTVDSRVHELEALVKELRFYEA